MKTGRNDPCPCNSGKKHKKCCGDPSKEINSAGFKPQPRTLPPENLSVMRRQKADEMIREQQQGLGRPIVSLNVNGEQIVAAGGTIYRSKNWKTFTDFLSDYIAIVMGRDWRAAELKKPPGERHPIMQWNEGYSQFLKRAGVNGSGEIRSAVSIGVARCYIGLAYNLYLIQHNVELQNRLVKRLRIEGQFQGAYYELIVANCLIRSGFKLTLEDETDGSSKHCEFSAVSEQTGKKYWVEAKTRSEVGILGKTMHNGTRNPDATSELIKHLNRALAKPAEDERLIFIDLNTTPLLDATVEPAWVGRAMRKLEYYERCQLNKGQSAYIIVTNISFHRSLQSELPGHALMAYGLGNDLWVKGPCRVSDIYRRKQKHIDIHRIIEAVQSYPHFPNTFDGSLPSETHDALQERVIIGETYFFEDVGGSGIVGTVEGANMIEAERTMMIFIKAFDGQNHLLSRPVSDATLDDYRAHGDAFFGEIHQATGESKDAYDMFEFFIKCYQTTPKDRLLELLAGSSDMEHLRRMEQPDLAIEYCERCVAGVEQMSPSNGA